MFVTRIPYHLTYRMNLWRRKRFAARLAEVKAPERTGPELPFTVVSFSCQRDLPDQIASWASLLRHLGIPKKLQLVSDGTHNAADRALVEAFHPRAELLRYEDFILPRIPARVEEYARQHPFGKKLAIFMTLQERTPVLYSDSDILYFPAANRMVTDLTTYDAPASYLLDCSRSHDTRLIISEKEQEHPVNGGMVYFARGIDFQPMLARFDALPGDGNFFSEQTIVHLAVRAAGGKALDPAVYILQYDDQWSWKDHYAGPNVALRHYISSIRHKMWRHVDLP